jgi:hypothetical protein
LIEHLFLFALATLVIVVMSAFYAEADDMVALKGIPRRFLRFYGACLILAIVVWLLGIAW